ncbi:MAG: glycoside hydrolase family 97 N-terminal domain-containing protein, partial [Prevotella sp.]|nr:glycoside hydrolase family 97 N-terminal domain-containing protein [Prevotella sp.]
MRKHNLRILISFLFCFSLAMSAQKQFTLKAPDGKLEANITVGKTVEYTVAHNGDIMLDKSAVALLLNDGTVYGVDARLSGSSTKTVDQLISSPVYKRNQITDNYNELTLKFKGDYSIVFRAYNDGIAYRFVSSSKKPFEVENEKAEFNFPAGQKIFVAYANNSGGAFESQYMNSFEQPYHNISLSDWNKKRLGISPLVVEGTNGKKVCIVEADLMDYPGMFLYPTDAANGLKGVFAPYPKNVEQGG